jgi:hypothetical protein
MPLLDLVLIALGQLIKTVLLVHKDHKDHRVLKDHVDHRDRKDHRDKLDHKGHKVQLDHKGHKAQVIDTQLQVVQVLLLVQALNR